MLPSFLFCGRVFDPHLLQLYSIGYTCIILPQIIFIDYGRSSIQVSFVITLYYCPVVLRCQLAIAWCAYSIFHTIRRQHHTSLSQSHLNYQLMGQKNSKLAEECNSPCRFTSTESLSKLSHARSLVIGENGKGQNLLQWELAEGGKASNIQYLLCFVMGDADTLITHKDSEGQNSIQYTIVCRDFQYLNLLLQHISNEQLKFAAVRNLDEKGNNCLHLVATHWPDDERSIELLLEGQCSEDITEMILHKNRAGQNVIQIAISNSKLPTALMLQRKLTDEAFLSTIPQLEIPSNSQSAISWAVESEDHRLLTTLSNYFQREVCDWILQNKDVGLSTAQIEILSPISSEYIIPSTQNGRGHAKRWAIVLYSVVDRKDGQTEADNLIADLLAASFHVVAYPWTSYEDMRSHLTETTEQIRNDVSVLALFIMAHGCSGRVRGEEGSYGPITDVIDATRQEIPMHIPLVSLICFCLLLHVERLYIMF